MSAQVLERKKFVCYSDAPFQGGESVKMVGEGFSSRMPLLMRPISLASLMREASVPRETLAESEEESLRERGSKRLESVINAIGSP